MKVLEFVYEENLKPVGGPVGYVHGLYEIDKLSGAVLDFLSLPKESSQTKTKRMKFAKARGILVKQMWFLKILLIGRRTEIIENNRYDIIHFHSVIDLYNNRRSLKRYNGIVVLTSHSPTMPHLEIFESVSMIEKILFYPLLKSLKKVDVGSFELADYIIFPCEEAEEPYLHTWKGFESFKNKNKHKFRYVLCGTFARTTKITRKDLREQLNIPDDAFVVSYVGRHNKIKGYDNLKKIGQYMLERYENVYFLIAGKEGPIKGLEHKRWIEIGWTTDPHSYVGASDVFVLPNKETYFDLIMLEVLSLKRIIVASKTGGNNYFANEHAGVFLYDSLAEAINYLQDIIAMPAETRLYLEEANGRAFEQRFESSVFYKNYITLLRRIYEENH